MYKSFEYKLFEGEFKQQKEWCYAMAFNEDQSIIFTGCNQIIKVNSFENGIISKELQQLNAHTYEVTCLHFLKQTKLLISASYGEEIIIWNRNNQDLGKFQQQLDGHTNEVNCLVVSDQEIFQFQEVQIKLLNFGHKI